MGEDYVRTARAKGLPHRLVVRRHAGPPTYVSVASLFGASAPLMVTNMVLVEYVFSVPGFFRHTKRALGQAPGWPPTIDYPTLQAIALWASVLIVAAQPARRRRHRAAGPARAPVRGDPVAMLRRARRRRPHGCCAALHARGWPRSSPSG